MVLRDAALEQLHRLPSTPVEGNTIRREFLAKIEELRAELAEIGARTFPEAVVCRASGIAHRAANSSTTFCGWQWAANPATFEAVSATHSGRVCRRCSKRFDRQGGVLQNPSGVADAANSPK